MRKPFIVYKRKDLQHNRYQVAFWDEDTGDYSDRRTTEHTVREYAIDQAWTWYKEGLPEKNSENFIEYLKEFWGEDGSYYKLKKSQGKQISIGYVYNNERAVISTIEPYFLERKKTKLTVKQITPHTIEKMLLDLQEENSLSGRRLNIIRQVISVPMAELERLKRIKENPVKHVVKFDEKPKPRKILTIPEAKKYFELEWKDPRIRTISLLAATSGMRLGECLGTLIDDIKSETINRKKYWWIELTHNWTEKDRLHRPKRGSEGIVPIPERTAEALQELFNRNPWKDRYVFWGDTRGRPLHPDKVGIWHRDALRRIGIDDAERERRKCTFHAWRHFYTSMMQEKLKQSEVQVIIRHAEAETTKLYSHMTENQRRVISDLSGEIL